MLQIRAANVGDAGLLRIMIRELAEYERELDSVTIREEDLARDAFGENPRFRSIYHQGREGARTKTCQAFLRVPSYPSW